MEAGISFWGQAYIGTKKKAERLVFHMKTWTDRLIDMVFRGVVGLVIIYVVEQVCIYNSYAVMAGVNAGTFLLTALLGVPGFLLIFAATLIHLY